MTTVVAGAGTTVVVAAAGAGVLLLRTRDAVVGAAERSAAIVRSAGATVVATVVRGEVQAPKLLPVLGEYAPPQYGSFVVATTAVLGVVVTTVVVG